MNNTRSEDLDSRLPEFQSYMENVTLNDEIKKILKTKGYLHRIKSLKELRTSYCSPLSLSHIDYYIKKYTKTLMNRFLLCAVILIIIVYFAFTMIRISNYYERFNNLDVSEKTFQKAISYYDNGDYNAALVRLEKLYQNGWDNYTTVHYLSQIYQLQNNYDAAAKLLLDNLTNGYGTANVTTNNKIFIELRDIWVNQSLSNETYNKVTESLDQVHSFSSLYSQAYAAISQQRYDDAEYYCQTLKTAGANGFYYTAYYTTVLINTGRINEAYELVMETVKQDTARFAKKISSVQRTSLINYILPHLNDSQSAECNHFLYNELDSLDIVKISDNAEPFIQYNDVEFLFTTNNSIQNLKYLESVDTIIVDEETTLVNGRECYYIKVNHYDGSSSNSEYFFMDMEQNIYIFMDKKYQLLPTDEPSDPGDKSITSMIERNYHHHDDPNIKLDFQCDELNTNSYLIKDSTSEEIIYSGEPTNTSQYGAFSYLTKDRASFTVFFTIDEAIILVTQDPDQKYKYLEGRYLLTE